MKLWYKLLRWMIGDRVIHEAIREGNVINIAKWLRRGFNVNGYDNLGCTPLQTSLLYKQHHCTVFLLIRGANPNRYCYSSIEEDYGPTIQPYFRILLSTYDTNYQYAKQDNESIIRLLTLYGLDNIDLTPPPPPYNRPESFQHLYEATRLLRQKIMSLQEMIKIKPPLAAYEASVELQQLWQQLSNEETNLVFKAHYREKADYYMEKTAVLRAKVAVEEKTTAHNSTLTEVVGHHHIQLLTQRNTVYNAHTQGEQLSFSRPMADEKRADPRSIHYRK